MVTSIVLFTSPVRQRYLRASPVIWDYPVCIPFKRVKQLRATPEGFEPVSPSTWNCIIYGPPLEHCISDIDKITCSTNSSVTSVESSLMSTLVIAGCKTLSTTKTSEGMFECLNILLPVSFTNCLQVLRFILVRLIHKDGSLMWKHALLYDNIPYIPETEAQEQHIIKTAQRLEELNSWVSQDNEPWECLQPVAWFNPTEPELQTGYSVYFKHQLLTIM